MTLRCCVGEHGRDDASSKDIGDGVERDDEKVIIGGVDMLPANLLPYILSSPRSEAKLLTEDWEVVVIKLAAKNHLRNTHEGRESSEIKPKERPFVGNSQAVPPACSIVAMEIMGLGLDSFWGNGYRIRDLPYLLFPQRDFVISPQT
ncbi:hypothetical protein L6452_22778 [Arctium lappa]|uniref:Uncharacterized protein n=1 Tax=Arctium lappa TaxID=4217 RepID=A0ACB9B0R5_ARCLA|nr:hypothetical protein L6452_22778 [Arctium lappa]